MNYRQKYEYIFFIVAEIVQSIIITPYLVLIFYKNYIEIKKLHRGTSIVTSKKLSIFTKNNSEILWQRRTQKKKGILKKILN